MENKLSQKNQQIRDHLYIIYLLLTRIVNQNCKHMLSLPRVIDLKKIEQELDTINNELLLHNKSKSEIVITNYFIC